jgi:hypothetical protein
VLGDGVLGDGVLGDGVRDDAGLRPAGHWTGAASSRWPAGAARRGRGGEGQDSELRRDAGDRLLTE